MTEQSDHLDLVRQIHTIIGPDRGFSMWIRLAGYYRYASNARREDVRAMLGEWLATAGVVNVRDPNERPEQVQTRLALEELCATLGLTLKSQGSVVVLFLFDFGDGGSLAWYSNEADMRTVVQKFMEITGGAE